MRISRLFPFVSASLAISAMLQTAMAGVTNSVLHSEPELIGSPLALGLIQEIIPLGNLNPAGGHVRGFTGARLGPSLRTTAQLASTKSFSLRQLSFGACHYLVSRLLTGE